MPDTLTITDDRTGKKYQIPVVNGTIKAMDLRQIKTSADDFGLMTYDPAFMNTASCQSKITFIDGDKGILQYRGYPIEQLAERSTYLEVAYLILYGELPTKSQLAKWEYDVIQHTMIHENVKKFMEGFHYNAHPMGMLVSTVAALSTFYPDAKHINDPESRRNQTLRLVGKMPTIAAYTYRHSIGRHYVYPDDDLGYTGNFLNMMFKMTELKYKVNRRSTCCLFCMPIMSKIAAPTPCAPWAARIPILTARRRRQRRHCTARCTAAPTRKCCACWSRSAARTRCRNSSSA
jgi:citrate synthase